MVLQKDKRALKTPNILRIGRNMLQPSVLTFASYDYTTTQSKILVQVFEKLQLVVKEAITNARNRKHQQLSLFTDDCYKDEFYPDVVRIRMKMKDFGIECNKYRTLRPALEKMASIPIAIPFYDRNGQLWEEIGSLFRIRFPKKEYIDMVDILIEKKTARHLLDLRLGYTDFYKEVVLLSKKQYTSRIYLMLSAYSKRMNTIEIKMEDLRKQLKLEKKYHYFRDFVKNVLEPAKLEVDSIYSSSMCDFTFDYEKRYLEGSRKSGEPYSIVFNIHCLLLENAASQAEEANLIASIRSKVYDMLRNQAIMINDEKAIEISQLVNFENRQEVLDKIIQLYELFCSPSCKVINKAAYAYKSLKDLLATHA